MVALLVREYDEAIAFYRDALGFTFVEDTPMAHKRWVRMCAGGGAELLLSRAVGEQAAFVGKQAGGRVLLFLHTQDFDGDPITSARPRMRTRTSRRTCARRRSRSSRR